MEMFLLTVVQVLTQGKIASVSLLGQRQQKSNSIICFQW